MKEPQKAKLFFLGQPKAGVFLVTIQTEEGTQIYDITADQCRGFIADGAAMAFRSREAAE